METVMAIVVLVCALGGTGLALLISYIVLGIRPFSAIAMLGATLADIAALVGLFIAFTVSIPILAGH